MPGRLVEATDTSDASRGSPATTSSLRCGAALETVGEEFRDLVGRLRDPQIDREQRRQQQDARRHQHSRHGQQADPGDGQDALVMQHDGLAGGDDDRETRQNQQRRNAGQVGFSGDHREGRDHDQRRQCETVDEAACERVHRLSRYDCGFVQFGTREIACQHHQDAGAGMSHGNQQQAAAPRR